MPRFSPALSASTKPFKKFTNYRQLGYNYKIVLPPALRDYVSNKNDNAASAYCVEEMSVMMACWKRNDFNQQKCSQELASFYKCAATAEAGQRAAREAAKQGKSVVSSGRYPSSQVNKMLKRFPQPPLTINLK
ncbi:small ribosomal subunit protein mS37-like isoform X2 [Babylonia areolata]|uniref:small ribosomal subunit protein mS37-like isoform X1 n=1 Tax=Babylonia areolata TaxID=304850 RepID=UPI003FD0339F